MACDAERERERESEEGRSIKGVAGLIESLGMSRPKGFPRKMEGSSLPAPWIPCVSFG